MANSWGECSYFEIREFCQWSLYMVFINIAIKLYNNSSELQRDAKILGENQQKIGEKIMLYF